MYLKPSSHKHFYLWYSISSFLSKTVESVQLHVCVTDVHLTFNMLQFIICKQEPVTFKSSKIHEL